MRQVLTIFLLVYSTLLLGQKNSLTDTSSKISNTPSDLLFIDSEDYNIAGLYITSNGHTGYKIFLDNNHTFQKIGFDCISHSNVDSGQWQLKDANKLLLTSGNISKTYIFFKIDNYYFIVPEHQRQKFINDYQTLKKQLKNEKSFIIDGKTYSAAYLISISLLKRYFAKQFDDLTGT